MSTGACGLPGMCLAAVVFVSGAPACTPRGANDKLTINRLPASAEEKKVLALIFTISYGATLIVAS